MEWRSDEEQNDKTKVSYDTTDARTMKNYNREPALEGQFIKYLWAWGGLLKWGLFARNLALNSAAAPNY